ncbi:quinone oxidoreductase [Allopusillimonas soli]|uniref:Quinone oxidoreductase n=1 Tax=Allopusillimonas soli TaxID=659016 RepID=A0A853FD83_9BURK|nr:quinone oxidoreductase [Allopusillimonas soli]NYT36026.1 quinone oxidoreductase [Allopusillimonas soli]TEA76369.1 quinone oxidoreductase [Allopusillimonas soli]
MARERSEAIIVTEHGAAGVMQWREVDVPEPAKGEVTIVNHAMGVNFIDVYHRSGLYPGRLPHGIGVEGAGTVQAVGPGVDFLMPGDRVAYAMSAVGAYARRRTLSAAALVKLPDAIGFEEAAAVMMKGLTSQYLLRQTYRVQPGETILFHAAAGGVGQIACQWARHLGVKLIGTASSPEKAALARENGAWETIDYSREDVVERVMDLTDGQGVPVVYDGVGQATWEASLACLQPRGLMVNFGSASGPVQGVSLSALQKKSLYVTRPGITAYLDTHEKLEAAATDLFDAMRQGAIKPNISHRMPLREAVRAHALLESRQTTGSTILIPGD